MMQTVFVFVQLETYRLDRNRNNKEAEPRSFEHSRSVSFSRSSLARVKTTLHNVDEGLDHTRNVPTDPDAGRLF